MMKHVFAMLIVLGTWTGSVLAQGEAIKVSNGWYPDEVLFPERFPTEDDGGASARRAGHSPDGFRYEYYPDGSGSVSPLDGGNSSGWSISCSRGLSSARRWQCDLVSYESAVEVHFDRETPESVCALSHDVPTDKSFFQVDDNPPVAAESSGCAPAAFLDQMLAGDVLTVTHSSEADPAIETASGPLDLLPAAIDLLAYLRGSIQRVSFKAPAHPSDAPATVAEQYEAAMGLLVLDPRDDFYDYPRALMEGLAGPWIKTGPAMDSSLRERCEKFTTVVETVDVNTFAATESFRSIRTTYTALGGLSFLAYTPAKDYRTMLNYADGTTPDVDHELLLKAIQAGNGRVQILRPSPDILMVIGSEGGLSIWVRCPQ
jgi:hypothetical protein